MRNLHFTVLEFVVSIFSMQRVIVKASDRGADDKTRAKSNFIRNLIDSSVDSFHSNQKLSERSQEQLERTEEKFKSNFNFIKVESRILHSYF
jgi:tRNA(Phe) wybutosine-synthesizing methylase Tyw3